METTPIPEPVTVAVPPPPKKRRWLTVLLIVVFFLTGAICGAGVTTIVIAKRVNLAVSDPAERARMVAHALARKLDLTNAQTKELRAILLRQAKEMQQIRRQIAPEVRQRLELTEQEINDILTTEQQAKWKELAANFRARWSPLVQGAEEEPADNNQPAQEQHRRPLLPRRR